MSARGRRALDDVGVELDAAIVEEEAEPGPAGEHIADRFRQLALMADEGELLAQPWLEGVGDGTAAGVANRRPLLGRAAADLALNLVFAIEPRATQLGRDHLASGQNIARARASAGRCGAWALDEDRGEVSPVEVTRAIVRSLRGAALPRLKCSRILGRCLI